MTEYTHRPVLVEEVVKYLITKKDGTYVDCTAGEGGHSEAILKRLEKGGRLVGIDCDATSLCVANERLKGYNNWVSINENFINIHKVLDRINIRAIDGVLFDLGFSSFQMENHKRGFSFNYEGPLDMRMSRKGDSSRAWDLVNRLPFEELRKIIREYGEEFRASRIARAIVRFRQKKTIDTTVELSNLIENAIPRRSRIHPATRTFQALRIVVNNELENLRKGVAAATGVLNPDGRICVISFHSLEDRIVKNTFRDSPVLKVVTKKPITALEDEVKINPRSRSAKLRAAEKKQTSDIRHQEKK